MIRLLASSRTLLPSFITAAAAHRLISTRAAVSVSVGVLATHRSCMRPSLANQHSLRLPTTLHLPQHFPSLALPLRSYATKPSGPSVTRSPASPPASAAIPAAVTPKPAATAAAAAAAIPTPTNAAETTAAAAPSSAGPSIRLPETDLPPVARNDPSLREPLLWPQHQRAFNIGARLVTVAIVIYCVLFADFGSQEHVYTPIRTFVFTQWNKFWSIDEDDARRARQKAREEIDKPVTTA